MKLKLLILILFSPLLVLSQDDLKSELSTLLDKWHNAAAQANEDVYFSMIAEEGVFIGTDSSENWTKSAFQSWAKPYFERGKAWTLKANSRNIYIHKSKKMAWFDELLYTKSGTWRGSGVLIQEKGEWKIQHYVLSITIPNEKMKKVSTLLLEN